jgi:tetratricopeptide (TPR) repeat protein
MQIRKTTLNFFIALVAGALVLAAQGQANAASDQAPATGRLGEVHFPTSCAPGVERTFEEGVALLHSFQYQAAEGAFKEVARQDPDCAMAYWGQAMTLWHQLWDRPDAATLETGREEVRKAEDQKAQTPREREYIAAAAAFYQERPKLDYAARAAAYSAAMGKLHEDHPEDGDAAAFYALSLIALPAHGDADVANREKAIAILDKLFAAEPDHPGAAHYLIHAADTPQLAPQGLEAARRYAKIAPASAHALHMPSHIFTRLGLWQESIASNLASAAAAAEATQKGLGDAHYQLHALDFLEYAYLQSGQKVEAEHVIEEVAQVPGATSGEIEDSQATFRARYAIETHDWEMAANLKPPSSGKLDEQVTTWWARAIGAARAGDPSAARKDVQKLDPWTAESKAKSKREGYEVKDEKTIDQLEAEAWLAYAEGRQDDALKTLRAAADREDADRVGSLAMPAREMLGDMLMEMNQPQAALEAYQTALKESPNRFDGVQGAAAAAKLAGKSQAAAR